MKEETRIVNHEDLGGGMTLYTNDGTLCAIAWDVDKMLI